MIQLIIAAVAAAAFAGLAYTAWNGFKEHIAAPYVAAQIASDQAHLDKADRNAKAAESERDNAKTDTLACQAASEKQSGEVKRLGTLAANNLLAAKEAKAKADRDATAAAPKMAELQAKAAAAPKLESCEIELGKAKAVLQDALRARRGQAAVAK